VGSLDRGRLSSLVHQGQQDKLCRQAYVLYISPSQPLPSNITIENLDKTKVTGIEQVDTLQDGVHNLAAGQVGQGGLLQPVGDLASKEGVNRAERQGRDENGGYVNKDVPGSGAMNSTANAVVGGGQGAAQGLQDVGKGVGNTVGGLLGGKKE